jgi:hypothetical protein
MLNNSKTRSKKFKLQDEYLVDDTGVKKNTRREKRKW